MRGVSASHPSEQPDPREVLGGGSERILERIWKLLAYIEGLQLMMDPDDLLRLKSQLAIRSAPDGTNASFCFRSRALLHATNATRDIKKRVPWVIGVEVDPNGGPSVQEADMRLYHGRRHGAGEDAGKIELLQSFQAVEAAVRRFFVYRQVLAAMCATTEASGNRALFVSASSTFWFDTYVIFLNENGVELDYSESWFWPSTCSSTVCL